MPAQGNLRAEALAALCTAARQDQTTVFRRHTGAESVAAFANQVARLEGAFHRRIIRSISINS